MHVIFAYVSVYDYCDSPPCGTTWYATACGTVDGLVPRLVRRAMSDEEKLRSGDSSYCWLLAASWLRPWRNFWPVTVLVVHTCRSIKSKIVSKTNYNPTTLRIVHQHNQQKVRCLGLRKKDLFQ